MKKTLFLSGEDVSFIINKVGVNKFMDLAIEKIENYFRLLGDATLRMPRVGFFLNNGETIESMPGRLVGSKICFKTVNFHEKNSEESMPTVMSSTILCDEKTGFQETILDSTLLTYIRTGATAAVASKYLARPGSQCIGLIGAGCTGQACLHAISRIYNLKEIYVWDTDKEASRAFKARMEKILGKDIKIMLPKKFIYKADIVVTTTYGNRIVVKDSWVSAGTHINAVGGDTPGKQELDENILKNARIIVDYKEQAIKEGEINVPISKGILSEHDIYSELADVVKNKRYRRKMSTEITVFDSTGDPIEDLAIARLLLSHNKIYRKGEEKNFIFSPENSKDPYEALTKRTH